MTPRLTNVTGEAEAAKRRILKTHGVDSLRISFCNRTREEMFSTLGALVLGPVRTAALRFDGLDHVVVWTGYEYLVGFQGGSEC